MTTASGNLLLAGALECHFQLEDCDPGVSHQGMPSFFNNERGPIHRIFFSIQPTLAG